MIRDERTKALINTDADALYKYKMERDKTRKMVSMQNDIDYLKAKVETLYQLLEDRIEKNNGKVINN
jgi:myo-inositol-hexaphosphate 3-phosphohydrolase